MTTGVDASDCARVLDGPEPLVGNYFVSTYPPFSCWTEAATNDYRLQLARPPASGDGVPLGLYVHVPFCIERCRYCYYLSHDDRQHEIDGYLDAVLAELRRYARSPALQGRSLDFVYFGGGTPSVLSTARIERLLDGVQQAMPWRRAREVTFECAPRSVTPRKLRMLRERGVTRISMGVQQMADEVLRQNGRVHLIADVERAWEAIRGVGFPVANLDLMVGLVGETDESFLSSLERVIGLQPESITIYQLEIPLNTPLYRALQPETVVAAAASEATGSAEPRPAAWDVKRARLRRAMEHLEAHGYTWRSAYGAVRDPTVHRFLYQDEQYHGADLLGVGVSAFSYLGGVHQQNRASLRSYLEACSRDVLPLGRAHVLSTEERAVRQFILQLKLGEVSRERFRQKFTMDPAACFAAPLADMVSRGFAEITASTIKLTRAGLLRVDRLVLAFYLPEHAGIRYS